MDVYIDGSLYAPKLQPGPVAIQHWVEVGQGSMGAVSPVFGNDEGIFRRTIALKPRESGGLCNNDKIVGAKVGPLI